MSTPFSIPDKSGNTALLLGAGASSPAPRAIQLKEALASRLGLTLNLNSEHLTLELLGSLASTVTGSQVVEEVYEDLLRWKSRTSLQSLYVAKWVKDGRVGPVFTTNFDHFLIEAFERLDVPNRRYLTEATAHKLVNEEARAGDVIFIHGVLEDRRALGDGQTPPSSMTAKGLAQPLPPSLERLLSGWLAKPERIITVIGNSGGDFFDLNPLLLRNRKQLIWLRRRKTSKLSSQIEAACSADETNPIQTQYGTIDEAPAPENARPPKDAITAVLAESTVSKKLVKYKKGEVAQVDEDQRKLLQSLFNAGVDRAYPLIHHYHLESLSLPQEAMRLFAYGDVNEQGGQTGEAVGEVALLAGALIDAQARYRDAPHHWDDNTPVKEKTKTFDQLSAEFRSLAVKGLAITGRDEISDAYGTLLASMALDYQGLCLRQGGNAAATAAKKAKSDPVEVEQLRQDAERRRQEAIGYFDAAADTARSVLAMPFYRNRLRNFSIKTYDESFAFNQIEAILPAGLWLQIARENIPTTRDALGEVDLFDEFERVIAGRDRLQHFVKSIDRDSINAFTAMMLIRRAEYIQYLRKIVEIPDNTHRSQALSAGRKQINDGDAEVNEFRKNSVILNQRLFGFLQHSLDFTRVSATNDALVDRLTSSIDIAEQLIHLPVWSDRAHLFARNFFKSTQLALTLIHRDELKIRTLELNIFLEEEITRRGRK